MVYVYDLVAGAWPLDQKLLRFPDPNFPQPGATSLWGDIANFRHSVSVDGDGHTLAIGAPGIPGPGGFTGSAFIFVRNGAWAEEDELAPDVALSASGTTLVVGAPDGNLNDPTSGQAFVFEKVAGAWGQRRGWLRA